MRWPGANSTALLAKSSPYQSPQWWGSVLMNMQDASGQLYRRNRYYDPATGRFTQEDPIGLAGGLNLYGFGGGDPVNYSDPYGLSATGCCREWLKKIGDLASTAKKGLKGGVMDMGVAIRGRAVLTTIGLYDRSIAEASERYRVDANLVRGIIFEEQTHMLPGEAAAEARGRGRTVGLGQVSVGLNGFTRQQLLDPETNIHATAMHLATLQQQTLIDPSNPTASIATRYNCGSCSTVSDYGQRVDAFIKAFFAPPEAQR